MPTIIFTGDLNSECVHEGTGDMRTQAKAVLHFTEVFCLNQVIATPTRGNNILDIIMINNDDFYTVLVGINLIFAHKYTV